MISKPKYFYLSETNYIFKLYDEKYYIYGIFDRCWFPYNISSLGELELGTLEFIEITEEELFAELL